MTTTAIAVVAIGLRPLQDDVGEGAADINADTDHGIILVPNLVFHECRASEHLPVAARSAVSSTMVARSGFQRRSTRPPRAMLLSAMVSR